MSALYNLTSTSEAPAFSAGQTPADSLLPASFSSTLRLPATDAPEQTAATGLQAARQHVPVIYAELLKLLAKFGFREKQISIGLAGYEGSNSRCFMAEIGIAATATGFFNLHLGGNPATSTLNHVYKVHLPEASILAELYSLLAAYKITRKPGETFGEFVSRKKII